MKKELLNFSDLSKRELEHLKDYYVEQKVNSMSNESLRKFFFENINHQIKETIGDDEEKEAWNEMENFFKDRLSTIVEEIKKKLKGLPKTIEETKNEGKSNMQIRETKIEDEKVDMW